MIPQFEYSHQNYVKYGFNQQLYNLRTSPGDQFYLEYGPCEKPAQSFKDELVRAALIVRENTQGPLWVALSGGMDSEVTLRAFQQAGIHVKAAILRYSEDANAHDISYALSFCRENSIEYQIFELDLNEFYMKEMSRFLYLQCPSPQFYPVVWLMEKIVDMGGCPIIGNGDVCLKRRESTNIFDFIESEKYFTYYSYLLYNQKEGIPAFLQYTPELFYSFLISPTVREYVQGRARREKLISISKWKHAAYAAFFDIEQREVFNGFEHLTDLDKRYREKLVQLFPGSTGEYRTRYESIVEKLRGPNEKCPIPVSSIASELHSQQSSPSKMPNC